MVRLREYTKDSTFLEPRFLEEKGKEALILSRWNFMHFQDLDTVQVCAHQCAGDQTCRIPTYLPTYLPTEEDIQFQIYGPPDCIEFGGNLGRLSGTLVPGFGASKRAFCSGPLRGDCTFLRLEEEREEFLPARISKFSTLLGEVLR